MIPKTIPGFSDPVSAFTHLFVGIPLFLLLGAMLLWWARKDRVKLISVTIYILANLFLFSMSGVYHLLERGSVGRMVLQRLDHAAIFILIAGTFTPSHMILFRGLKRWGVLILVWLAAIISLTFKTIFFADFPEGLGLALYLGIGWLGLLSAFFIWVEYGFELLIPLLAGALCYSVGAVLEFLQFPILIEGVWGYHESFHVAVLMGALCFGWLVAKLTLNSYQPRQQQCDNQKGQNEVPGNAEPEQDNGYSPGEQQDVAGSKLRSLPG